MAKPTSEQDVFPVMPSGDIDSIEVSEPVMVAVLLGQPDMGIHKFPYLKGQLKLKHERSVPILNVVFRSAYLLHRFNPKNYLLKAAQVFYRDRRVEEVRLDGEYFLDPAHHGSSERRRWTTADPPKFSFNNDGSFVLSPEDQGRPHISVLLRDSSLFFSWDVVDNACHKLRKKVDLFSMDIPIIDLQVEEGETASDTILRWEKRNEARRLLHQVPLTQINSILRPRAPSEAELGRSLPLESNEWAFGFTCDEAYARYRLALCYAENVLIEEPEVKEIARRHSISVDEAKEFVLVRHIKLRDAFSEEGRPMFNERVRLFLSIMTPFLLLEAPTMALKDWSGEQDQVEADIESFKEYMLTFGTEKLKELIETRGRGWVPGKKRKSKEQVIADKEERERRILKAIADLRKEARDSVETSIKDPVNYENIAARLEISSATLYNWLKSIGKTLEDLKAEVISNK